MRDGRSMVFESMGRVCDVRASDNAKGLRILYYEHLCALSALNSSTV